MLLRKYGGRDQKYDLLQLFHFAEEFDKEHPIHDRSFYMVSGEGAIGISPGMEYLTKWLFIPAMDEASIAKLQTDIQQLEAQKQAEEQARLETEEKARREAEEAAKREAEERAKQAEAAQTKRAKFCPHCGTPYKNDNSKFCINCGKPRE